MYHRCNRYNTICLQDLVKYLAKVALLPLRNLLVRDLLAGRRPASVVITMAANQIRLICYLHLYTPFMLHAWLVFRFAMCEGVPHLDYRDIIAICNLITMVTNMVFKIYLPRGIPWHFFSSCLE